MSEAGADSLLEQLQDWFAARRPRIGAWDDLALRELKSIPSLGPPSRRRRFDLVFKFGPLSNEYPTTGARSHAAALPTYIEALIADGLLDGLARARSGPARPGESSDETEHVTLEVVVPLTVELLGPDRLSEHTRGRRLLRRSRARAPDPGPPRQGAGRQPGSTSSPKRSGRCPHPAGPMISPHGRTMTSEPAAAQALAEAWDWLFQHGLVSPDPVTQHDNYFVTRRGLRVAADAAVLGEEW